MLDHYYVYIDRSTSTTYYCNNSYHNELPNISEGWDPYTSWMVIYPSHTSMGSYASNNKVRLLLINDEFILPDYCTSMFAGATSVENLDKCIATDVIGTAHMFSGYRGETIDLSMLTFSSLQFALGMFEQCSNLRWIALPDIDWQYDQEQNFSSNMFAQCPNLERIFVNGPTDWMPEEGRTWIGGSDVFKDSNKLPYYYNYAPYDQGGIDYSEDRANSYVELRRKRYDPWSGQLDDQRLHRGGFFTPRSQVIDYSIFQKTNDIWRQVQQAYIKDTSWKRCESKQIEDPNWVIPPYEYEEGWYYYAILPSGEEVYVDGE